MGAEGLTGKATWFNGWLKAARLFWLSSELSTARHRDGEEVTTFCSLATACRAARQISSKMQKARLRTYKICSSQQLDMYLWLYSSAEDPTQKEA